MEYIKKRLDFTSNVTFRLTNRSSNLYTIETNSVRGVANVVEFIERNPTKLKGNKRAQYLKWLCEIRLNPRYHKVNTPNTINNTA
jgi:hypothetical protein